MKYGYFDDQNKEYVITNPATPEAWANYLGSPQYGAIISNNAGGYSFVRSGANGRILRYNFNGSDRPGRYIYLRDNDSLDFWSASWQPVGKDLVKYSSRCRHGLGYTVMEADYAGIHSEVSYYVPAGSGRSDNPGHASTDFSPVHAADSKNSLSDSAASSNAKDYEVWYLHLKNTSDQPRSLTVTGFCEFTNNNNYEQDQVNLQYSRFISRTVFHENHILQQIQGNLDAMGPDANVDGNQMTERFFGLTGAPVNSFCGDRNVFLGAYHDYGDPEGVMLGDLGNVNSYNEFSCGALSSVLTLEPGETRNLAFVLGMHNETEAAGILSGYESPAAVCPGELQDLKDLWSSRLSAFHIETPSKEFNTMINIWNAYNCYMTFTWSRAASFIYCGLRNGYGYRDTVQDIQGVIHLDPEAAAKQIRFMLTAQVDNGAGLPLVKFTHNPGHEDTPDDASYRQETGHPAYRADDALWLFPTVYKYISESGNLSFLDEVLPYANHGEDTVYNHLKRAITFSMNHLGPHGMPAGLYADWNDCLRLGAKGESTFVAFQFYYAMTIMQTFAEVKKDGAYQKELEASQKKLADILNENCWNEDRFVRGFTEDGAVIGRRDDPEANLWLNPQSWSVISGLASAPQAQTAMALVRERLNTAFGAILMDPPYHAHAFPGALAVIYNPGVKENAGIFSQTQGWLILAEALLGHGNTAFSYWLENSPAAQNDLAEIRHLEPYCYGQFTEGKASPHFGRSQVHWLTGTASTMMVGCVEGILGIRPDLYGLHLSPSIPSAWESLKIEKTYRGHQLHITIQNPEHRETGCAELLVNGRKLEGNYIPESVLQDENTVTLTL